MASVSASFEIRNDRIDRHDDDRKDNRVLVKEQNRRTISLSRELDGVEDAVWALEAEEHEVIHDLWGDVKDDPEFEEWGFYSPYPHGDVSVNLSYTVHWHHVIQHVAARDGINEPLALYMNPPGFWRVYDAQDRDSVMRAHQRTKSLVGEYLAWLGHDMSEWTHGQPADRDRRPLKRVTEALQLAEEVARDRDD